MIIKFLLKIWPALLPISLYLLWILVIEKIIQKHKKKGFIEGEYKTVTETHEIENIIHKAGDFSLKNYRFIMVIYLSLALMIISFLYFAIRTPHIEEGKYIPAETKDGKVVPGKIINLNPEQKNP